MNEPEPDIRRLWHDQPREEHAMSTDTVRSKAVQFEKKVRRWNRATAVLFVLVIFVEAWQVWREPTLLERTGDLLTVAAFIYVMFRFRGRMSTKAMPAGLGLTSSVDFYRQQLARQRDVAATPREFLAPFVPGVGLSLLGRSLDRPPAQTAAVAAFGVALFLAVAWINRRTARKLQREIDELV
jgi:hypothetical protein